MIWKEPLAVLADPRNLDKSVHEVFETMLGVSCRNEAEPESFRSWEGESITAVVGFGGFLSGACVFRCDAGGARQLGVRMTGTDAPRQEMVMDAIGEICNMLAGTWKSKVPLLVRNGGLSLPAVIAGSNYNLHLSAPEFRLRRSYAANNLRFELIIVCARLRQRGSKVVPRSYTGNSPVIKVL